MSGPVIGKCEACGNELRAAGVESWNGATYCELPLAPGITAKVCAKESGRGGEPSTRPKGSCARLVRQRRALCPGCGESRYGARAVSPDMTYAGVLCEGCASSLARQRVAETREVQWYSIAESGLVPYVDDKRLREAALALAEAVAGSRRWAPVYQGYVYNYVEAPQARGGGRLARDPVVEMHAEQAEALRRFLGIVYEIAAAERKKGFEEGENLLKRLADGDFRPLDHKQWGAK